MQIIFDPDKDKKNLQKHGLSFIQAEECDWEYARFWQDTRKEYGEIRYSVMVPYQGRLHNIVCTFRENDMRIISFRKANIKERLHYAKETGISGI